MCILVKRMKLKTIRRKQEVNCPRCGNALIVRFNSSPPCSKLVKCKYCKQIVAVFPRASKKWRQSNFNFSAFKPVKEVEA